MQLGETHNHHFRNSKKRKERKGETRAFELSECDKRSETEGGASHLNTIGKGEDSSYLAGDARGCAERKTLWCNAMRRLFS
jgi:hypothetical protein